MNEEAMEEIETENVGQDVEKDVGQEFEEKGKGVIDAENVVGKETDHDEDLGAGAGAPVAEATSEEGEDAPKSWRDSLKDEGLRGSKSLAKFEDVDSLAKSYVELSKKLGSKGLLPLPKGATEEQAAARRALKRGEGINSPADYGFEPTTAQKASGFNGEGLSKALFEAGADKEVHNAVMKAAYDNEIARKAEIEAEFNREDEQLRDEWNEDYDVNRKAVEMFVSKRFPEVHKGLMMTGGYRVPAISKMFLKLNEMTADGEVRIERAKEKSFDERLSDIEKSEAYRNEWHPDHRKARSAWANLIMEKASGGRR